MEIIKLVILAVLLAAIGLSVWYVLKAKDETPAAEQVASSYVPPAGPCCQQKQIVGEPGFNYAVPRYGKALATQSYDPNSLAIKSKKKKMLEGQQVLYEAPLLNEMPVVMDRPIYACKKSRLRESGSWLRGDLNIPVGMQVSKPAAAPHLVLNKGILNTIASAESAASMDMLMAQSKAEHDRKFLSDANC